MKTFKILTIVIFTSSFFLISCTKTDSNIVVDEDIIESILEIDDFSNTEDEEAATNEEGTKSIEVEGRCFEVIINENENGEFWPRNWTLDFGDENCENHHGITKMGMIHTSLTDYWRNEGSLRTITFENFYVDSVLLEGIKTIENTGLNESGNMTWLRKTTDGKLSFEDGTSILWESIRYVELVEGLDTWMFQDDVYLVTGGRSGVNKDGNNFSVEIITPTEWVFACRFPVSGVVEINVDGYETATIDYGTGECDNLATKTVNGVTTEIELGKRRNN